MPIVRPSTFKFLSLPLAFISFTNVLAPSNTYYADDIINATLISVKSPRADELRSSDFTGS